ncbi:MAG: hypothetical protein H6678_12170 [Candidatus Delongbacteria bacterium]|nr:hypothetical protein [Candidatus Cloacimonadota bacterium]MCB9474556.1 hypothetical protein [Candidatus Delongbacteria bacterium]
MFNPVSQNVIDAIELALSFVLVLCFINLDYSLWILAPLFLLPWMGKRTDFFILTILTAICKTVGISRWWRWRITFYGWMVLNILKFSGFTMLWLMLFFPKLSVFFLILSVVFIMGFIPILDKNCYSFEDEKTDGKVTMEPENTYPKMYLITAFIDLSAMLAMIVLNQKLLLILPLLIIMTRNLLRSFLGPIPYSNFFLLTILTICVMLFQQPNLEQLMWMATVAGLSLLVSLRLVKTELLSLIRVRRAFSTLNPPKK